MTADEPYLVAIGFRIDALNPLAPPDVWVAASGENNLGHAEDDWAQEGDRNEHRLPPDFNHLVEDLYGPQDLGVTGVVVVYVEEDVVAPGLLHTDQILAGVRETLAGTTSERDLSDWEVIEAVIGSGHDFGGIYIAFAAATPDGIYGYEGPATDAVIAEILQIKTDMLGLAGNAAIVDRNLAGLNLPEEYDTLQEVLPLATTAPTVIDAIAAFADPLGDQVVDVMNVLTARITDADDVVDPVVVAQVNRDLADLGVHRDYDTLPEILARVPNVLQVITELSQLRSALGEDAEEVAEILLAFNDEIAAGVDRLVATTRLTPLEGSHSFSWRFPVDAISKSVQSFGGDHQLDGSIRTAQVSSGRATATTPLERKLPGVWSLSYGRQFGRLYLYDLPGTERDAFSAPLDAWSDRGLGLFFPFTSGSGESRQIDRNGKRWVRLRERKGDAISIELCEPGNVGSANRQKEYLILHALNEPSGTAMLTGFQIRKPHPARIDRYQAGAYARKGEFLTTPSAASIRIRPAYEDVAGRWAYVEGGRRHEVDVSHQRGDASSFRSRTSALLEAWGDERPLSYDTWKATSDDLNTYLVRVKNTQDTYSVMPNHDTFAGLQHARPWPSYRFGLVVDCEPTVIAGVGPSDGAGFYLQQVERYVAPEVADLSLIDNPYDAVDEFAPSPPSVIGVVLVEDDSGQWTPVVNAVVKLTPTGGGRSATMPAQGEGRFSARLRRGTWRVSARKGDLTSNVVNVELTDQDEHVTLRIASRRVVEFEGPFYLDKRPDIRPSDGLPIAASTVERPRLFPDLPAVIPQQGTHGERRFGNGKKRAQPDLPTVIPGTRETARDAPATPPQRPVDAGPQPEPPRTITNAVPRVDHPTRDRAALKPVVSVVRTRPESARSGQFSGSVGPPKKAPTGFVGYVLGATKSGGPYHAVPAARVEWIDGRSMRTATAVSRRNGRFDVQVSPVNYQVRVTAPRGYTSRVVSLSVRPGMKPPRIVLAKSVRPDSPDWRAPAIPRMARASKPIGRRQIDATPTSTMLRPARGPQPRPAKPAESQARPVTLRVSVKSNGGEFGQLAVSGAVVRVSQANRVVFNGTTNASGSIVATLPKAGSYQVSSERSGYRRVSETTSVGNNSRVVLEMRHR